MFIPEDIVGKGLLKLETIVELLKGVEENDNLFADFPIGATMQDGGKRKRSDMTDIPFSSLVQTLSLLQLYSPTTFSLAFSYSLSFQIYECTCETFEKPISWPLL